MRSLPALAHTHDRPNVLITVPPYRQLSLIAELGWGTGREDRREENLQTIRKHEKADKQELAGPEDYGLRNVIISCDPALLLHESLDRQKISGDRLTIAFNFGEPAGGMIGSEARVAEHLATVAREVARKHRVKVIPIWPQDVAACARLALRAGLSDSSVTPPCITHQQFRREMQDTDLLIAFKLHAGILAAAYNVPFVLFEYQPKCRDFMASVGWEQFCIRPSEDCREFLLDQVARVESFGIGWREEIHRTVSTLAEGFEKYCRKIEPLM
jgi:polysaccharide pyruvyl transferase WcaK-like protein